jgi:hypothetical protein
MELLSKKGLEKSLGYIYFIKIHKECLKDNAEDVINRLFDNEISVGINHRINQPYQQKLR